jgi:hypothetical protein
MMPFPQQQQQQQQVEESKVNALGVTARRVFIIKCQPKVATTYHIM